MVSLAFVVFFASGVMWAWGHVAWTMEPIKKAVSGLNTVGHVQQWRRPASCDSGQDPIKARRTGCTDGRRRSGVARLARAA